MYIAEPDRWGKHREQTGESNRASGVLSGLPCSNGIGRRGVRGNLSPLPPANDNAGVERGAGRFTRRF